MATGDSFDDASVVVAGQHFAYAAAAAAGECFVFVVQVVVRAVVAVAAAVAVAVAVAAASFARVAWTVVAVDVAYNLDLDPENHHVFVGSADVEEADEWKASFAVRNLLVVLHGQVLVGLGWEDTALLGIVFDLVLLVSKGLLTHLIVRHVSDGC